MHGEGKVDREGGSREAAVEKKLEILAPGSLNGQLPRSSGRYSARKSAKLSCKVGCFGATWATSLTASAPLDLSAVFPLAPAA